MKTILDSNSVSLYLLENDEVVNSGESNTTIGDPIRLIISDLNIGNSSVELGVATPPEDWIGGKYIYSGGTWLVNPDYVVPEV